jgi:hypothetical protein
MSPKKLLFCYQLPTWGRAGVKLGDAWYVSNVSIIFWCSILVYTPFALCFVYSSWNFYAFFGTNLLTTCHSASSYFLLFLCFRKVTHEIFSELDKTKAEVYNYLTWRRSPKESRRRTKGQPHLVVARTTPWPCHQVVWPPGPPPDNALPPISWETRSSSRHPAREGNHHRRPSSSPCLPLEWWVSSLPWTMGP